MELEAKDYTSDKLKGFVKILKLENAQQVTLDSDQLTKLLKLAKDLKEIGFEEITITVEANQPLIIGGKNIGIALVPLIEEE